MKDPDENKLIRSLGLFTATLLVSSTLIGSGVFKKIIPLSQTGLSESWILIAWAFAGFITMLGAFNLSGLASMTEETGGVYEYLRLSFGNFFSFMFGWADFTIIGSASIAAIAFIFAQTLNTLIPLPNPFSAWSDISIGHLIYPFADSGIKILALATIIVLSWVNYRGAKESGRLNNIFTLAKITGIIILIVGGLFYATPPYISQANAMHEIHAGLQGGSHISAFFIAMLAVLWAYDGWMDISFLTGEVKNPKRNVPLAIIIGVSLAMILYVLINHAYMNVLSLDQLASVGQNEIGAAAVAKTLIGRTGVTMIIFLIMISVFGTLNAIILSHTRIYFRMAEEKFFFPEVAKVHPKYKTPYISLFYTMIWSCILVVSGTFDILSDMVIFANFLFYGLLAVALIKMKKAGKIKIKVIGYPVIQIILILFSLSLILNTIVNQPKQTLAGIGLILIGVPFYYYFRKKQIANLL
jgi:basic amino acid/polyamine antiporter, APA family